MGRCSTVGSCFCKNKISNRDISCILVFDRQHHHKLRHQSEVQNLWVTCQGATKTLTMIWFLESVCVCLDPRSSVLFTVNSPIDCSNERRPAALPTAVSQRPTYPQPITPSSKTFIKKSAHRCPTHSSSNIFIRESALTSESPRTASPSPQPCGCHVSSPTPGTPG